MLLNFYVNSYFLASLIPVILLVWSYMNRSKADMVELLCMSNRFSKAKQIDSLKSRRGKGIGTRVAPNHYK
jgi:hypothetical protein